MIINSFGMKYFYYPEANIYSFKWDRADHIGGSSTICLLHDYNKERLHSQARGIYFKDCHKVNLPEIFNINLSNFRLAIDKPVDHILFWAREHLPEHEVVLLPASGAGTNSYWSNPESVLLAKLSLG